MKLFPLIINVFRNWHFFFFLLCLFFEIKYTKQFIITTSLLTLHIVGEVLYAMMDKLNDFLWQAIILSNNTDEED